MHHYETLGKMEKTRKTVTQEDCVSCLRCVNLFGTLWALQLQGAQNLGPRSPWH